MHCTWLRSGDRKAISSSGEVYADGLSGMGTGIMHLIICYINLFYFAVYQAGF